MLFALLARFRALHVRLLLALPLLLTSLIPSAQPAAAAPGPFPGVLAPGVLTGFSGGGVYLSPDGKHLGGGGNTSAPYVGEVTTALLRYRGGTIAAFESGNVYFSPDGNNLHSQPPSNLIYGGPGAQQVLAMTEFQGGVMTSFSGGGVYWSPDGTHYLVGGAGTRPYLNINRAIALVGYANGVITAFEDGDVWFSPDGQFLHGGGTSVRVYGGTGAQRVLAMTEFQGGVMTSFSGGGVYWSPDPTHYLVGQAATVRYLDIHNRVIKLLAWRGGLFAAFEDAQIWFSSDGWNLHVCVGTSTQVYAGAQLVRAMALGVDVPVPIQTLNPTTVPNCVGLTEPVCESALTASGLVVGTLSYFVATGGPPYVPVVVGQTPAANTVRPPGSCVALVIEPESFSIIAPLLH